MISKGDDCMKKTKAPLMSKQGGKGKTQASWPKSKGSELARDKARPKLPANK